MHGPSLNIDTCSILSAKMCIARGLQSECDVGLVSEAESLCTCTVSVADSVVVGAMQAHICKCACQQVCAHTFLNVSISKAALKIRHCQKLSTFSG